MAKAKPKKFVKGKEPVVKVPARIKAQAKRDKESVIVFKYIDEKGVTQTSVAVVADSTVAHRLNEIIRDGVKSGSLLAKKPKKVA